MQFAKFEKFFLPGEKKRLQGCRERGHEGDGEGVHQPLVTEQPRQHPPHRAGDARTRDQEGGLAGLHPPGDGHVRQVGVGDVQGHRGQEVARHDGEEQVEGGAGGQVLPHH